MKPGGWSMRGGEPLRGKGTEVVTVDPQTSVKESLRRLVEHNIGALVVSEDGRRIQGILSERDVVRAIADRGPGVLDGPVASVMTAEVRTCDPETTVNELMGLMTERRIRHVPVVVDEVLSGIVSIGDVVKHRLDELQTERDQLTAYIRS